MECALSATYNCLCTVLERTDEYCKDVQAVAELSRYCWTSLNTGMQAKQHISLLERTTSLCYWYSSLPHTFILIILYKTPRVSQTTSLPNKYLKGKVERSSRCSRAGQKSFLKNLHKIHFDFKYEVFLMDMSLVFFPSLFPAGNLAPNTIPVQCRWW